nr:MAG TPA: hypothetical protein [Caudoviricetes sp.]
MCAYVTISGSHSISLFNVVVRGPLVLVAPAGFVRLRVAKHHVIAM